MASSMMSSRMPSDWKARIGQICLLAALYVTTGKFGLEFASYQENATLIWAPTGLSLAALILFGPRLWPGVFLGTLVLNSMGSQLPLIPSLAIATGNTLEALVGAVVLSRMADFRPSLERLQDVAAFVLIGGLGCTLISATIGVSTLELSGLLGENDWRLVWLIWWLGDVSGALVLAPSLLLFQLGHPSWKMLLVRSEWWITFVLLTAASAFAFSDIIAGPSAIALVLAPLPLVVWAGIRLGPRGAAVASLLVIALALNATASGSGPFVIGNPTDVSIFMWGYSMLIAITASTLAAVNEQRNVAEEKYRSEESERMKGEKERLLLIERQRLTREMHDGLGSHLVSALAMVERGYANSSEIAETLRRALDDIRIVIDSLDSSTTDLPTSLGKLRARLMPLLVRNGVDLEWRVDDIAGIHGFSGESTLHILRIIQEAVNNSLRHAHADTVEMSVTSSPAGSGWLRVLIRDNGCGLSSSGTLSGRGIRNMRARAEALHAKLRVERVSPGTQIELDIPISRPRSDSYT